MNNFTIFPAIDLRNGKIVRLAQGDPTRQTIYGDDPRTQAEQFKDDGAKWIHVINLSSAFGEEVFRRISVGRNRQNMNWIDRNGTSVNQLEIDKLHFDYHLQSNTSGNSGHDKPSEESTQTLDAKERTPQDSNLQPSVP